MNNLAKRKFKQFNPNINELQNHHSVIYSDETGNENVSYSRKRCEDPRKTPFTIRMLEPGKIIFALIPEVRLNNEIYFNCVKGPNIGSDWSVDVVYDSSSSQWIESCMWSTGDEIEITLSWYNQYTRGFGFTIDIGSALFCTGKFEVFGNLGQLLCNSNETYWKKDNFEYYIEHNIIPSPVNGYLFNGFFRSYDDMDITSEEMNYTYSAINNLVNAEDLYLPKIPRRGVYMSLFEDATQLEYLPKFFEVCDNEKYCVSMFGGCNHISQNSSILIKGLNKGGYNEIMNNMFDSSGGGNIYITNNDLDIDFCHEMFLDAYPTSIHISPGGSTTDVITGSLSSITDKSKILEPVIWVDIVETSLTNQSQTLEQYISAGNCRNLAIGYRYIGTIWIEHDCRSYYIWELASEYNSGHNSSAFWSASTDYILTTEKNFIKSTLEETGKIQYASTIKYFKMDEISSTYINYSSSVPNSDKLVVTAQDGYIPYETAGLSEIGIDYNYGLYEDGGGESDFNYKYYSNDVFRCIGKLNNKYLFREVRQEHTWGINKPDPANPSEFGGRSYATSSTLNFEHTLLNDFTTDNYYNINILAGDMNVYRSDEDIFIIKSNEICPENCDYTVMS